jgi:hypothetical protein
MIVKFGRYILMTFTFIALLAAAYQPAAHVYGFLAGQIGNIVRYTDALCAMATAAFSICQFFVGAVLLRIYLTNVPHMLVVDRACA